MQSSYSIIKSRTVEVKKNIDIKTSYLNSKQIESSMSMESEEEAIRAKQSLESMRKLILGGVEREKEKIIKNAYEKAKLIEKETYEKAYNEGFANGKEDGYKDAYEGNIQVAEKLVKDARSLLENSKIEYEKYLEAKKSEIIELTFKVCEHILEREIKKEDGINDFIIKILESSKESKSFVIRCNSEQMKSVKERIEKEKQNLGLRTEICFVGDEKISIGNALVELEGGTVEVGIDNAIESIKREVF
ncbi:MAG: FliH/SctL family protein [Sarcina sp.]